MLNIKKKPNNNTQFTFYTTKTLTTIKKEGSHPQHCHRHI